MIIRIKFKLSFGEANRLIEKYYDGLTTGIEERQLQKFLLRSDLPEQYKAEQAIFGYFDHKKEKTHVSTLSAMRWVGIVAAVVLVMIVVGPQLLLSANQSNYAYIDGKKVSDMREIRLQAIATLDDISSSKDEVKESLKNINDKELIELQLEVFSELEK